MGKFGCLHRVSESICEACFDIAVSGLRAENATLREDLDLSASRRTSAESQAVAMRAALEDLYDKWENGTPCYEVDDEGEAMGNSLGNAVHLTKEEEDRIIALLRPRDSGKPS